MADRYVISTVFQVLDKATAPMRKMGTSFRRLNMDIKKMQESLKKTGQQMTKLGKTMSTRMTLPMLTGAGLTLRAFNKQAQAVEQVRVGIEATGGVAGRTLQQLRDMASDLQENTLFGDEEILAGATAQLLTFTNIAGKQFDRTQQAILDVATRLAATRGGSADLTSTSIMLGKALNDPVANMGALSRAGIQFSKDQKEVIKTLAESGRLADAQSMILGELEKQYGGSAAAAAKAGTGGLKQLSNAFGDLMEDIGSLLWEFLAPLVEQLKGVVASAREWVSENPKLTKTLIKIAGVLAIIGPALIAIGLTVKLLAPLLGIFKGLFAVGKFLLPIFTGLGKGAMLIFKVLKVLIPIIVTVGKVALLALGGIAKALIAVIIAGGPILWLIAGLAAIATLVIMNWGKVSKFFSDLWESIGEGFDWLLEKVTGIFSSIGEWLSDLGATIKGFWDSIFGGAKKAGTIKVKQETENTIRSGNLQKALQSGGSTSKIIVDVNAKKGAEAEVRGVQSSGKNKPQIKSGSMTGYQLDYGVGLAP